MKAIYTKPETEITMFNSEDIITVSVATDDQETIDSIDGSDLFS